MENVMKLSQKTALSLSVATILALPLSTALAGHGYDNNDNTVKISLTNISSVVFTPPIFALCNKRMAPIAKLGKSASDQLEPLAEGGDTSGLASLFDDHNCTSASHSGAVAPGETITVELMGSRRDYLHFASMLLPTNDGFTYSSGYKAWHIKRRGGLALNSYDAGTEINDEMCSNIPGPQCGGEGFNATREDNNFVRPHPGIQGFSDVSAETYNWGDPVATIKVK